MRATDIIRGVLDLIDNYEQEQDVEQSCGCDSEEEYVDPNAEGSRFRQILAQIAQREEPTDYDNSPSVSVSDCDAVTSDAGGGLNGPSHPDDIRVKDPRQDG